MILLRMSLMVPSVVLVATRLRKSMIHLRNCS